MQVSKSNCLPVADLDRSIFGLPFDVAENQRPESCAIGAAKKSAVKHALDFAFDSAFGAQEAAIWVDCEGGFHFLFRAGKYISNISTGGLSFVFRDTESALD